MNSLEPSPVVLAIEPERKSHPVPHWHWLLQHPARLLAFGGGSGLSHQAPGTMGTLAVWPVYVLLQNVLSPQIWAVVLLGAFVLGVWACERTGRELGVADHGGMVWDEMVAFCLVLLLLPQTLLWQSIGFGLFRFFDIVKPPPIGYFDRVLKGGFGVMWDDLVAAFYALLVAALLMRLNVI